MEKRLWASVNPPLETGPMGTSPLERLRDKLEPHVNGALLEVGECFDIFALHRHNTLVGAERRHFFCLRNSAA